MDEPQPEAQATEAQANAEIHAAPDYHAVLADVSSLQEDARRAAARSVNAVMTAAYWQIGRRLVEVEQGGASRADYGTKLLKRLAQDLTVQFGRGFSERNLEQMRLFYQTWPISQTVPAKLNDAFPLSWSHYVRLLSARTDEARRFYEEEARRGGWSLRQLSRQTGSQFYERTALSRNKAAMLTKGAAAKPEDAVTAEAEVKDPFVLESLGLFWNFLD